MKKLSMILGLAMIAGIAGAQQMDYCIGSNPDRSLIPPVVTFKQVKADGLTVGGSQGISGSSTVATGISASAYVTNATAAVTAQTQSIPISWTLQTVSMTDTNGVTALVVTGIVANVSVAVMTNGTVALTLQKATPTATTGTLTVKSGAVTAKP